MNESILKALMSLFAIIANVDENGLSPKARKVVASYLNLHLNQLLVEEYLMLFDKFLGKHHRKRKSRKKGLALNSVKVLAICSGINEELQQNEKIIVMLRLLEFIAEDEIITPQELEFISTVADVFNIPEAEYIDLKTFVTGDINEIKQRNKLLLINNNKNQNISNPESDLKFKHIYNENLEGLLQMLHIESTNTIVLIYKGEMPLYLNSQKIIVKHSYIFGNGSIIRSQNIASVYYSDIINKFIHSESKEKIIFEADAIKFQFKNSQNGIQKFTFKEKSGHLIGIMGGSGVGKSTLFSVLIGNLKLNSGSIKINGYNLETDKDKLEGVIGYIPQDDLMIEELTVFQNLYYSACLCFKDLSKEEIIVLVDKVLQDLGLFEIKDLKVGTPLNKFISGGQRKRLNVALELIREPSVMFVDEPTSGLSSSDSEIVMTLLKEQTLKGKLLFVNIHQPSSDIYKLFDRIIVMDKGGFPVFFGNPIEAILYFKQINHQVNASEADCPSCGNVNPEQVLDMVGAKTVNEYGQLTKTRKNSPREWYDMYQEKIAPTLAFETQEEKIPLPSNFFKIPSALKQFKIFSIRNLLSKLTNKQYLFINLLEAPFLALILAYFTKYSKGNDLNPDLYIFAENVNISAYLFMSIIVSLFMGLTVSAEEIIKDRLIQKRESFLNLSRWAYLNSKIIFLFLLSAIQSLSFVLVGNMILEIRGMTFEYWIILFAISCIANIIGLNISSLLNSVVTIYITIPLILVPQILLSGTVVNFDKLNKNFASQKFVPIIGDLMTSRWGYEALMVTQFKRNKYEKHFFDIEKKIEDANYKYTSLYDNLENKIRFCTDSIGNENSKTRVERDLRILSNEIAKLEVESKIDFAENDKISYETFDNKLSESLMEYISEINKYYNKIENKLQNEFDAKYREIVEEYGSDKAVADFKSKYYNIAIEYAMRIKPNESIIVEDGDELIRKSLPIFKSPEAPYGRAHFYAASKNLFGLEIDTLWFNTAFIWLTTFLLYLILVFDVLNKMTKMLSKITIFKKLKNIKLKR